MKLKAERQASAINGALAGAVEIQLGVLTLEGQVKVNLGSREYFISKPLSIKNYARADMVDHLRLMYVRILRK